MIRKRERWSSRGSWLVALATYALLAWALGGVLVAWCDPAFAAKGAAVGAPALVALNAVPAALAVLLLLGLTRRAALSLWLALLLLYALYTANALKLDALETPLLPADFVLLAHVGDGSLLARYLTLLQALAIVAALAASVLLYACEPAWRSVRGARRLLLTGASAGLCASLLLELRPWSDVYAATVPEDFKTWSPAESALHSGLPTTLLRYAWSTAFVLPPPDLERARELIDRHPAPPPAGVPAPPEELPDIVVVQSESFFDAARLRGVEPAQVLPEYRRLAAAARHGDLWVPAYGGGTIRTEFEVLTGIAMRYFPDVEYPYLRLTAAPLPSLVRVLAAHGYQTVAVHPNARTFWNRASAFAHLGFAAFDDEQQFGQAERFGYYISDRALTDHVLARLETVRAPAFVFAISMEGHGPYDGYPVDDPQRIAARPVPPVLSPGRAERLRGYLAHLDNADRELGRLAEALRRRPRRTLLLFYGDHLPSMPRVFNEAGFDDGADGVRQPVPWLLLDTAQAQPAAAPQSAASFYLPALLLEAAGIDDGGYFALLGRVRGDDQPSSGWTPLEDEGLRAIMLLRQRGEFAPFFAGVASTAR
ncbi:MAG: LTA synthase family protein [Rhodanobacteraceae bacterium]|nr:LTA synthase family protein [Rhodanobacteraceae bacterium]